MTDVTQLPFPLALSTLLVEGEISQSELARRCRKLGKRYAISQAMVSLLEIGEAAPSKRAMEAIARALQVSPETFCDYRLMLAREVLDPQVVGYEAALQNLGH